MLRNELKRDTVNNSTAFRNNNKLFLEIYMKYKKNYFFPEVSKNLKIFGELTKYYGKPKV